MSSRYHLSCRSTCVPCHYCLFLSLSPLCTVSCLFWLALDTNIVYDLVWNHLTRLIRSTRLDLTLLSLPCLALRLPLRLRSDLVAKCSLVVLTGIQQMVYCPSATHTFYIPLINGFILPSISCSVHCRTLCEQKV